MRRVALPAIGVIGVTLAVAAQGHAQSADVFASADAMAEMSFPAPISPDRLSGGFHPDRAMYFSGFDIWNFGYGGYVGAEWTPASGANGSVIVRLFAADGIDRFRTTAATYRNETVRASFMPGWRVQRGKIELKAFAGFDYEARIPNLWTSGARIQQYYGLRIATDIWWEPTELIMLAASAALTTVEAGSGLRLAAGWRLSTFGWAGPELSVNHDIFNTQTRVGAHLTGFRVENTEWSIAAGYVRDSFGRDGGYGRLSVVLKQ